MIGVSQHASGKVVLERIKALFGGIGSAVFNKDQHSDVLEYRITKPSDLLTTVIPFLQHSSLRELFNRRRRRRFKYNKYSALKPRTRFYSPPMAGVVRTLYRWF